MLENGIYRMWYNGCDGSSSQRVLFAYSADGVVWTKLTDHSMLEPGPGSWDSYQLGPLSVLHANDSYHMWYTGCNQDYEIRIGYATSPDGLVWTKVSVDQPVLGPGAAGAWDCDAVAVGCVRLEKKRYVMFYFGSDNYSATGSFLTGRAIGGATAPGLRRCSK